MVDAKKPRPCQGFDIHTSKYGYLYVRTSKSKRLTVSKTHELRVWFSNAEKYMKMYGKSGSRGLK